ncbi:MAG: homocysteine S-methyltransferase family protein [Lachnospiraceae bacterium]|nr:homocysteine S-methyltransferase family protein [Lachnospiraceae bacterium]
MSDVYLLDGAVGTSLWEKSGDDHSPVWQFNLTKREIVKELLEEYIEAGSELVLTNTFGVNRIVADRAGFDTAEVIKAAMEILHEVIDGKVSKRGEPIKGILSSGPLTVMVEPYGDMEEDECFEIYDEIFKAAVPFKPDYLWLQTFMDLNMQEIAVRAADQYDIPIFATMSFEKTGKTMFGNSPKDVVEVLGKYKNVCAVGMNCSVGPDTAVDIIKEFSECTDMPLIFKPNAGLPIGASGESTIVEADDFVKKSLPALEYGVKYIGGCCGSNPEYIRKFAAALGR